MEVKVKRFALICNLEGRIEEIIHNDDHILSSTIKGSMLFSGIVAGDLDKILNFFIELKEKGSAIGWEINLNTPSGPETFSFFGGMFDNRIGIAAATTKNGAQMLFSELTKINNEQTNLIRAVTKERAILQNGQEEPGVFYYEELTRLNNDLVNIQRELSKKNRELDELNKLKNQFLGIAAHDLRNPIGVVLGYSELMLDDQYHYSDVEKHELIEQIHQTGTFMLGLVNNLLDIANIESGQLELNLSEQELCQVVRETIQITNIFAHAKSMELHFEKTGFGPLIAVFDRPKIEQVLTNLLSNAIKYSHPGSKILIRIESKGKTARVSVIDNGQGIREEELYKLFKPFQKTSTRATSGEKSTGLGLSIVKKIVEAHHGECGVTSKFGKGSEFFFTLPLQ